MILQSLLIEPYHYHVWIPEYLEYAHQNLFFYPCISVYIWICAHIYVSIYMDEMHTHTDMYINMHVNFYSLFFIRVFGMHSWNSYLTCDDKKNLYMDEIRIYTYIHRYTYTGNFLTHFLFSPECLEYIHEIRIWRATRGGGLGSSTIFKNLMSPTPRSKWYLTTGRRAH